MANDLRVDGLAEALKMLRELGELGSKRGGPIRSALSAAAKEVRKEVQAEARSIRDTGNTQRAVYQHRHPRPRSLGPFTEVYSVGVRKGRIGLRRLMEIIKGMDGPETTYAELIRKTVKPNESPWAGVVEFGAPANGKPPQPFFRTGVSQGAPKAVNVFRDRFIKGVARLVRKHNRGQ